MSYVFYIHKELSGNYPKVNKAGKAITPFSVVRLRQRFLVDAFELEYIWFGNPSDITWLEEQVMLHYRLKGLLKGDRSNTELIWDTTDNIRDVTIAMINLYNLDIHEITPTGYKYSATNSSNCPLGFPGEKAIHDWAPWFLDKLKKVKLIRESAAKA